MTALTLRIAAGDLHVDINGQTEVVKDSRKVAQDVAEYVLKELESSVLGSENDIRAAISRAIMKLKTRQSLNPNLTASERIKEITSLFTLPDSADPTVIYFVLDVALDDDTKLTRLFDTDNLTDLSHLLEN